MRSGDECDGLVDETIDESFPASDPPSTWAGADRGHPHHEDAENAVSAENDENDARPSDTEPPERR
jgi:hypothetical protein